MPQPDKDNLLAKLLALKQKTVENGCTEAEAQAAAEMVQALLLKYNIDISELDSDERQKEKIEENHGEFSGRMAGWKIQLMGVLADHYLCKMLILTTRVQGKHGKKLLLVGKPINTAIAREMYDYLVQIIHDLSWKAMDEERAQRGTKLYGEGRAYAEAWRQGCVNRINERLIEKRAKMATQGDSQNNVTALQIINLYERENQLIEEFIKSTFGKLGTHTTKQAWHRDAYHKGYKRGDSIGLDNQLKESKISHKLLN